MAEARHLGGRRRSAAGPAAIYTQEQLRGHRGVRAGRASSRSFPRSTCPATRMPRSRRTPELNCDGVAPAALHRNRRRLQRAVRRQATITYTFIDDVVREIAAMTSGPYFHIGGDEVKKLTPDAVQTVHRARAEHRADARQADDRLGRGCRRGAAADVDRAALAADGAATAAVATRRKVIMSPGQPRVSRHEVRQRRRCWA